MRWLVAIPVYNEAKYVERVLAKVLGFATDVLVIDDGSSDETPRLLTRFGVDVIRHCTNRGYGRSMRTAFSWADEHGFDWVITMDCDEQHEPAAIPMFVDGAAAGRHDVISGSRYMPQSAAADMPPADRRRINTLMTQEINERLGGEHGPLGLSLTDAFCGFKAYRVAALRSLSLTEDGYAFPMQFWVQAAANRLRIREVPVKLIYNDLNRTFGGPLDVADIRLGHYRRVLHCELARCADRLPPASRSGMAENPCGDDAAARPCVDCGTA
jgi:dolichol-phosphate mannosyltransferase